MKATASAFRAASEGITATAAIAAITAISTIAAWSSPAAAAGFDEGQARSRIGAAGYADVAGVHEGDLGEWMAQASKDGRHVMVVLHPDGSVALRQEVDTPPVQPAAGGSPVKP